MTARRVPGADAWALCCDAPGCEARTRPSATFGLAVRRGPMEGWAVTVRTDDPSIVDLCQAHRGLASKPPAGDHVALPPGGSVAGRAPTAAAARVRHPSARPGRGACPDCGGIFSDLAAHQARSLPAIGVELEERYCEVAAGRLAQAVLL